MEEIKVGEYVRTTEGYIGKYIKDTTIKGVIEIEDNEINFPTGKHNIVKHGSNIIDLIEEGDYVSSKDGIEGKVDFVMLPLKIFVNGEEVLNDEIKSIVTHEQFAQIEYKVEE